jgi:RimJ/RimL family protein N-acetyltransferase
VFETRRIRVRKWRESDLNAMLAVYGDREAMQWVGDGEPISTAELQPQRLRTWHRIAFT